MGKRAHGQQTRQQPIGLDSLLGWENWEPVDVDVDVDAVASPLAMCACLCVCGVFLDPSTSQL